ncbi:MAG: 3'-5' exonuclease [Betaproteobacteria bacterium]
MGALSPAGWFEHVKKQWLLYHLENREFRFMFEPPPDNEWVALDCETTGLNVNTDEIISIAAVRIVGNRVMTSERLELLVRPERRISVESVRIHQLREQDVARGMAPELAMTQLMHFIGSRQLVGYYLEFDIAMIDRALAPLLGVDMGLPQRRNEVSAMYYDYKFRQLPAHQQDRRIDLRFATLMNDLDLPLRNAHDALNDAVMAALAFVKLRHLLAAGK